MNHWKMGGVFFGYPNCCSDWFVQRLTGEVPFELNETQLSVDDRAGFIPCPSCAQKIKDGETTHKELIQNRICSKPYPHEGNLKELEFFISELEYKYLKDETLYEGSYIDVRDNMRYLITVTYQLKDGEMFNEKEIKKKELGRVL